MSHNGSTIVLFDGTSPASESTSIKSSKGGLQTFNWFVIDALLTEATGGTLDVFLQRKVADDVWADWLHFTQLAAGSDVHHYTAQSGVDNTLTAVGFGSDSAAGPLTLAAGTFVGGHPGSHVRVVLDAGASTSAGATQTIRMTRFRLW